MFQLRFALPLLVVMAAPLAAHAQSSVSNTYHVQIQKLWYFSGGTEWHTVMSTTNYQDALLMQDLLDDAIDGGTINSIMGNTDWRSTYVDTRIDVERPEQLWAEAVSWWSYRRPPTKPRF